MTALDCRRCGACCSPEIKLPFYVGLTATDVARLTPRWRAQNVGRASLLTRLDPVGHCVCVALQGTIGRRVHCRIYTRRPAACRQLAADTAACWKARRQAGLGGRG